MKVCKKWFPLGTFKDQKTDGMYIDEALAANLDILCKSVGRDMHHTILITGNDQVRIGKSVISTNIACYMTEKINQIYGLNNTFTNKNMCFNGEELTENSFDFAERKIKNPVIALDEGDDITNHPMKKSVQDLKRYFRRCGELNQILIIVLPSFFELPKFFALSRSTLLINVKFFGEFQRGIFDFYSMQKKKLLYLKGKKEWNYQAVKPDFSGRFTGNYTFYPDLQKCVERYKKAKHNSFMKAEEEENFSISKYLIHRNILMKMLVESGHSQASIAKYLTEHGSIITAQAVCAALASNIKRKI